MCDHLNREAAMTVLRCDTEGNPTVWCDPCIADVVEALQPFGTVWSCCGHGRRPPIVGLDDGRQVVVFSDTEQAKSVLAGFPDINAPIRQPTDPVEFCAPEPSPKYRSD